MHGAITAGVVAVEAHAGPTVIVLMLWYLLAGPPCVKVRITNGHARTVTVAHGPVDLIAEVRVQPDENHRYLETVWDYAPHEPDLGMDEPDLGIEPEQQNGAVGSSLRSLNGVEQPIRNDVKMHHLEGGTYVVTSTVYTDAARKKVCGRATARVVVH